MLNQPSKKKKAISVKTGFEHIQLAAGRSSGKDEFTISILLKVLLFNCMSHVLCEIGLPMQRKDHERLAVLRIYAGAGQPDIPI